MTSGSNDRTNEGKRPCGEGSRGGGSGRSEGDRRIHDGLLVGGKLEGR